ncbi:MAG TPA: hypothetical protein VFX70_20345 [Mycobacteriales bacterium]|nr:hypothetical protein [Mycobacteriales bacterium]
MDDQWHRPWNTPPDTPPAPVPDTVHPAYQRLGRTAGQPLVYPGGYREYRPPAAIPAAEPVCARCHAWASCCYCRAEPEAMREALRRIAELHSACQPALCPERARLAAVPRRPAE